MKKTTLPTAPTGSTTQSSHWYQNRGLSALCFARGDDNPINGSCRPFDGTAGRSNSSCSSNGRNRTLATASKTQERENSTRKSNRAFRSPFLPKASRDAFDCPALAGQFFLTRSMLVTHTKSFSFLLAAMFACMLSSTVWAQSIVGEVVAIADGDTLTVLDANRVQHKIRLAGIDAPERKQPFGQRSRQMLADLVFRAHVEVIAEKKDRYGRTIGKVIHQGRDVNLVLVSEGMAWHYKQYAREQSAPDRMLYAAAEEEARTQRKGLWRDPHPVSPWSWRAGVRRPPSE